MKVEPLTTVEISKKNLIHNLRQFRDWFKRKIFFWREFIEDTLDPSFAMEQLEVFKKAVQLIEEAGIKLPLKHTACSAATILYKETFFDMVRIRISLYGFWPSEETKIVSRNSINLKPVLTWKTKVVQIKTDNIIELALKR